MNAPQVSQVQNLPVQQETSFPQENQYGEFANVDFEALYDPKKFEHLPKRNYSGMQMPEIEMAESKPQKEKSNDKKKKQETVKCGKRKDSDLDGIVNPREKLRCMIDADMSKELEEFRKNNGMSNKSSLDSNFSIGSDHVGAFAEAVLGTGAFVQKTTDPLDKVLNPFAKNDKDAKGKPEGKSKDLAKFLPSHKPEPAKKLAKVSMPKDNSPKTTGFSLSRFWKKK